MGTSSSVTLTPLEAWAARVHEAWSSLVAAGFSESNACLIVAHMQQTGGSDGSEG